MPSVTLSTRQTFPVDDGISILEAARAHGIALEFSCRTGRCGVCKAPVTAGETRALRQEESLPPGDAAAGVILTCCRTAISDVTLDIEDLPRLAGIATKTIPARIVSIDPAGKDVVRVVLRTPPTSRLEFLPGQYVDVILGDVRRSYSLANAPRGDGHLELLVKRFAGGAMSAFWFERAKPGDLVRLEGPLGTFFLRDEAPTRLLFLATGTGIAPVKAILEELAAAPERAGRHRIGVYWGNRRADAFCWSPDALDIDLSFTRLLSGGGDWSGRRGHVQQAALEDGFAPDDTAVYACGSDAMIRDARARFEAAGLPSGRFFSDAFVSSN